ncbi:hypothetical protein CMUS01_14795 [Colletotrichum musicola]|uniref:Secreted protein n=1 Tax=Colletotrichum musicola TaxID=2175873 RepID=A0A8H6J1K8_9PEZI|nr:hypothetical protein CMUS01_14795 [Colletotrichum musicola]
MWAAFFIPWPINVLASPVDEQKALPRCGPRCCWVLLAYHVHLSPERPQIGPVWLFMMQAITQYTLRGTMAMAERSAWEAKADDAQPGVEGASSEHPEYPLFLARNSSCRLQGNRSLPTVDSFAEAIRLPTRAYHHGPVTAEAGLVSVALHKWSHDHQR